MRTTLIVVLLAALTVGLVLAGTHPIAAIAITLLVGVGMSVVFAVIGMTAAGAGSRPGPRFLAGLQDGLRPLRDIFRRR
jgi:hypothetical protein